MEPDEADVQGGIADAQVLDPHVFGRALALGPVARRFVTLTPAFGTVSLLFGAWYVL
jgi:hypothetical protein